MTPIFSEVLRPTEFADLIQPAAMVQRLKRMAEQRTPMNMLFYGQPGVGKTTAARILLNKLEACCYEINGSMETGIERVRKNIEVYCSSMSLLSAMKVCFIDECEYLSMNAQASLRGLIEKYDHVRFRMQSRKPILPPSRAVLILLPLTLIDALDYASNVLNMHRTDVIRRSLMRDVNSLLKEEVSRAQRAQERRGCPGW